MWALLSNPEHAASFEQLGEALQRRMEAHAIVDLGQVFLFELQLRPIFAVFIVVIRHDGIQAIIAAIQLKNDEDVASVRGLVGSQGRACQE